MTPQNGIMCPGGAQGHPSSRETNSSREELEGNQLRRKPTPPGRSWWETNSSREEVERDQIHTWCLLYALLLMTPPEWSWFEQWYPLPWSVHPTIGAFAPTDWLFGVLVYSFVPHIVGRYPGLGCIPTIWGTQLYNKMPKSQSVGSNASRVGCTIQGRGYRFACGLGTCGGLAADGDGLSVGLREV
jgi:hypothetical protein